jgi:phosphoribosyl 1,2-cyclic phosphate phosphodiesterase
MMTTKQHQLTVLGSGTSTGIPMVGCHCPVCLSPSPLNKRLRASVLLDTANGQRILIDTTPDLRLQLLRAKVDSLDHVFITHDHADHLHGIDDLRPLTFPPRPPLSVWTHEQTHGAIQRRYPYLFDPAAGRLGGGRPNLEINALDLSSGVTSLELKGDQFELFLNPHGTQHSMAIVHDSMAYIVDCHEIAPSHLEWLRSKKLELLIIDCVQKEPHQTHLWLDRSVEYIEAIAPKKAGLIHMGHKLEHIALERELSVLKSSEIMVCFDEQVLTYRTA